MGAYIKPDMATEAILIAQQQRIAELEKERDAWENACAHWEHEAIESQAREAKLREALESAKVWKTKALHDTQRGMYEEALALPQDDTALSEALEKMFADGCEYGCLICQEKIAQAIEDEEQNPWKQAIIDEAIVSWTYNGDNKDDPRKVLPELIAWHCQVALDPAVSSDAANLVKKAQREILLELLRKWRADPDGVLAAMVINMAEELK